MNILTLLAFVNYDTKIDILDHATSLTPEYSLDYYDVSAISTAIENGESKLVVHVRRTTM